ncbi:hypothetical protein [Streptomyces chartreusis]
MRIRIRKACPHALPQCPRCRGTARWTYPASPTTHHDITAPVRLCLECWTGTRREGET